MRTRSALKALKNYGTSQNLLEIAVGVGVILILLDDTEAVTRFAIGGPAGNLANEILIAELNELDRRRNVLCLRHV